jgi:hypothetical protein
MNDIEKIFRKVKIEDRLPELNKWVTIIDEAEEHFVYRLTDIGWNMRDNDAINTPNNNRPLIYWLEEVDSLEAQERYEKAFAYLENLNYIPNESNLVEETHFIKALKIAAGLEK